MTLSKWKPLVWSWNSTPSFLASPDHCSIPGSTAMRNPEDGDLSEKEFMDKTSSTADGLHGTDVQRGYPPRHIPTPTHCFTHLQTAWVTAIMLQAIK
jgi:hypothetical protein